MVPLIAGLTLLLPSTRSCRIVSTSCRPSCESFTVLDEFLSPATNLSLKSWRVKALAWSLIQVGAAAPYGPWRTYYRAPHISAHDNRTVHRNPSSHIVFFPPRYRFRGRAAVQHEPRGGDDARATEGAAPSGSRGAARPTGEQGGSTEDFSYITVRFTCLQQKQSSNIVKTVNPVMILTFILVVDLIDLGVFFCLFFLD